MLPSSLICIIANIHLPRGNIQIGTGAVRVALASYRSFERSIGSPGPQMSRLFNLKSCKSSLLGSAQETLV